MKTILDYDNELGVYDSKQVNIVYVIRYIVYTSGILFLARLRRKGILWLRDPRLG